MEQKVVVILLNYNQNNYTFECINSILDSDYQEVEIVLLDNGSEEVKYNELYSIISSLGDPRITICRITKNIGYVGGINYGLKVGMLKKPSYFLIMNNDTIIDQRSISELVSTCNYYQNMSIVSGKVYHYDEKNILQEVGYKYKNKNKLTFNRLGLNENDSGQYNEIQKRDMLDDVFWLFPVKLYEKIGGYCKYFWFNAEQVDYALRAKELSYQLLYTPKAKIWHKGSVSIGGRDLNPKLVYWDIQSSLILRYIHLNSFYFILFFLDVLQSVLRTSIKAYVKFIKGDSTLLRYAKAKRSAIKYFIIWLAKKNENTGENPF